MLDGMIDNSTRSDLDDRINALVDSSTLMGDLRDALLDRLKGMPKPWTVMSEAEQRDMIFGCERVATHLVTQAVRLIAANGHPSIQAELDSCTVKDGIKAVLNLSKHDPMRHELTDAVGKTVMVVVADIEPFMGQSKEAKPDPDQTTLPGTGGEENVKPFKGKDKG